MSRLRVILMALLITLTSLVALASATAPANADECYSWGRDLGQGATGDDVAQLQIRVAGHAGYGVNMGIDGDFGPQTAGAVSGFQSDYGLPVTGVADGTTYNKIYELQDADCTPINFSYAEVTENCGVGGFDGGSVSAAEVQSNLLRVMWRAQALRHRMGDIPLTVTSGFRSQACDIQVGGSGTGQHTYDNAIDLVGPPLCDIAQNARYAGFGGIYGPGYPGHDDHIHMDIRPYQDWSAPNCGI